MCVNNKIIGNLGEHIGKKYLENFGYKILNSNFKCKQGEIDLIAENGEEVIFIEVKTRENKKFGYGIDAVDNRKQKHIKQVAKYYIYKNNLETRGIRFDILEIYLLHKKYYINHIKNIMW